MTVYVLECRSSGNIKVGYTARSIQSRLKELNTAASTPLVLVKLYPGLTQQHEQQLHAALEEYRVAREWFKPEALLQIDYKAEALFLNQVKASTPIQNNAVKIKSIEPIVSKGQGENKNFELWLQQYINHDSPIGDFADDHLMAKRISIDSRLGSPWLEATCIDTLEESIKWATQNLNIYCPGPEFYQIAKLAWRLFDDGGIYKLDPRKCKKNEYFRELFKPGGWTYTPLARNVRPCVIDSRDVASQPPTIPRCINTTGAHTP